jgi:hypothetical protein
MGKSRAPLSGSLVVLALIAACSSSSSPDAATTCCASPNQWWEIVWSDCSGQNGWSFVCAQSVATTPSGSGRPGSCSSTSEVWTVNGVAASVSSCTMDVISYHVATAQQAVDNGCVCGQATCGTDCCETGCLAYGSPTP